MAEAELQGIISGDASDFVAASKTATRALGKFTKSGEQANTKLKKTFGGSTFKGITKSLGQLGGRPHSRYIEGLGILGMTSVASAKPSCVSSKSTWS